MTIEKKEEEEKEKQRRIRIVSHTYTDRLLTAIDKDHCKHWNVLTAIVVHMESNGHIEFIRMRMGKFKNNTH